jgi:DNA-binding MarR family transcriptional regulator
VAAEDQRRAAPVQPDARPVCAAGCAGLAEKGDVERRPHPTDTRARALSITPAGRALAIRATEVVEEIDRAFFNIPDMQQFNQELQALIAANQS